jgi:hypothetical protein
MDWMRTGFAVLVESIKKIEPTEKSKANVAVTGDVLAPRK